jgi:hypothetical protein
VALQVDAGKKKKKKLRPKGSGWLTYLLCSIVGWAGLILLALFRIWLVGR